MEYIIKYNGNLDSIRDKIEILSAGYAIIDIEPSQIKYLRELKEIEYWEPTKNYFYQLNSVSTQHVYLRSKIKQVTI